MVSTPATTRRADWPEQLGRTLECWRYRRFEWGKSDCIHFARDVLSHVTTQNWSALELPDYTTAATAYRAMRLSGFKDLADALTQLLAPPVSPALAQRGDLLLVEASCNRRSEKVPFPHALAVCGGKYAFAPARHGLTALSMSHAHLCWRI